ADRAHPRLALRLEAEKPLAKGDTTLSKANAKTYARDLAQEVAARHFPGTLTLVVLNRVRRAQEVFGALQAVVQERLRRAQAVPELLLIHSHFRPAERQRCQERLQEVDQAPPPGGCIVVATQAVEAGVDISARLLFTELAPWTSLVQRFGRCNRRGEWGGHAPAQVFWVDIVGGEEHKELTLPYEAPQLAWARETLAALTEVGPRAIDGMTDPTSVPLTHVLRRRDLLDLFDTTPDLAGNDVDVSRYIRDAEDNDVQVYWREWQGDVPPADMPAPRREELCPVSLPAMREFLKNTSAYRWDGLERRWIPVRGRDPLWPGVTLLLHAKAGGYDSDLGWTGKAGQVPPVTPALEVGETPLSLPNDALDADPASLVARFIGLREHADAVAAEMERLLRSFDTLPDIPADDLRCAARWHDAGKAHEAFQNALLEGRDADDSLRAEGPWAKSDAKQRWLQYGVYDDTGRFRKRPHFRHELASALLLLQVGGSDLAAYLVAAHHGKVRMSIRSLPGEAVPPEGRRFARGIWEGDRLPALDLGAGVYTPPLHLRLTVMELGEGEDGPSWLERALRLRDRLGPFRLAWLEMLVRVADWRGTLAGVGMDREEVMGRA
ncbi:MAG: HD domain-containing protein, partial [Bacillota bacterium]